VKSNTWWSSVDLAIQRGKEPVLRNLYAHPLAMRAYKTGSAVFTRTNPRFRAAASTWFPYAEILSMKVAAPGHPRGANTDWSYLSGPCERAPRTIDTACRSCISRRLARPKAIIHVPKAARSRLARRRRDHGIPWPATLRRLRSQTRATGRSQPLRSRATLLQRLFSSQYLRARATRSSSASAARLAFVTDTKIAYTYDEPTGAAVDGFPIHRAPDGRQKGLSQDPIVALTLTSGARRKEQYTRRDLTFSPRGPF